MLPHLLLSAVFALGWWNAPVWVPALLIAAVATSVWGWRQGRPTWIYTWLGYSIIAPPASWVLATSTLGIGAWEMFTKGVASMDVPIYIASVLYLAGSVWIIWRIVPRVARLDFVLASLAVLPMPFIIYWTYFFYAGGQGLQSDPVALQGVNASASVAFLFIAVATALFLRLSKRLARAAVLVVAAAAVAVFWWMNHQGMTDYAWLWGSRRPRWPSW